MDDDPRERPGPSAAGAVEILCRMQLTARRLGYSIRVEDPTPSLRELIELLGLTEVLLGRRPVEAEDRRQPSFEKDVQPSDPAG